MGKPFLLELSRVFVQPCDLLKLGVVIDSIMIIVRLLSPEPVSWLYHHQLYSGLGADIVMESISLTTSVRPAVGEMAMLRQLGIANATDDVQFLLQYEVVHGRERQAEEQSDAAVEQEEHVSECPLDFFFGSFDCCGVRDSPMSRHRLSEPDRTDFLRRIVADGKDKIE